MQKFRPETPASQHRLIAAGALAAVIVFGALPPIARGADSRPQPVTAKFAPADLPADRDGASLLAIAAPGRYAIRVSSAAGARIELVDMVAGPIAYAGTPGQHDGRIDALLDAGVYKIRLDGMRAARGRAVLTATPFVEAGRERPALARDAIQRAELGDMQQRSYALDLATESPVAIEAVGRALGDLRVWQADGALADLVAESGSVETKPGRPMNSLRLEGKLPAGRYVVTAYGGESQAWSDGAADQPFLLRFTETPTLAAGVAEGVIGPFGTARFVAPPRYDAFRLDLPTQGPVRLLARRGSTVDETLIDRTSRAPAAVLGLPGDETTPAGIEIIGREGQPFNLRAVRQSNRETFSAEGPHLVMVDVAGAGADEAPATALLARLDANGTARAIASDAPRIGPTSAWRGRFNLFGPTSILFEATGDGPVTIDAKGPRLRARIEPALGTLMPRADGRDASHYDLTAGFYFLVLEPEGAASGVVDVSLGPPGVTPPAPIKSPRRAMLSFGAHVLEKDASYLIVANMAPQLLTGPRLIALPAEPGATPLALHQDANAPLALDLRLPGPGTLALIDEKGAAVAFALENDRLENEQRRATLKIAPIAESREIGLIFRPKATAEAAETTEHGQEIAPARHAAPGRPAFFDLGRDETRTVRIDIPTGGLYRIETLGRVQTILRLGTATTPQFGLGDRNGPGGAGTVTQFLRAGAYRATVVARESGGHLGVAATQATLVTTNRLVDSGAARTTLAPGRGAETPIEITRAGDYRIELDGLKQRWTARIEDADGWPIAPPGPMRGEVRRLEPGHYRLVVSPADVEARLVVRLAPVEKPLALEGHGPHDLPFGAPRRLQWREPASSDAPRAPDQWRFTLAGDSDVTVRIGVGMVAEIFRGERESIGRFTGDRPFSGLLTAGDYRIEARSLAHDDRLDYEISLDSPQLQPGVATRVEPPARLQFSLAHPALVDFSTRGGRELTGVLKTAAGDVVERLRERADDWSLALSRRLPAGAYRLELGAGDPAQATVAATEDAADGESVAKENAGPENDADGENENARTMAAQQIRVQLNLVAESDAPPLVDGREVTVDETEARRFALPVAPAGALTVTAAHADVEIALAIERQEPANGEWRIIETTRGRAPVVALPDNGGSGMLRAIVWPLGGEKTRITIGAYLVDLRAQGSGAISLAPVGGAGTQLCAAKVATPGAALVDFSSPVPTLAGSAPGRALRPAVNGALAPQSGTLWLMTRGDCRAKTEVAAFDWRGQEATLDLDAGERAQLPPLPAPRGKTRLWLARAAFTTPRVLAGAGAGTSIVSATGAALALDAGGGAQVWNAAPGAAAARVSLRAIDLATSPPIQAADHFDGAIPPGTAQPIALTPGDGPLRLDLAGGLSAFVGAHGVFSDGAAISRILHGSPATTLLVNATDRPLPARVARLPGVSRTLDRGAAFRGFFAAGGEIALPIRAHRGDRLSVIGARATVLTAEGRTLRGETIDLDGDGEAILEHPPGLVAAWIDGADAHPWPQPTPQTVAPPQHIALSGETMRLVVRHDAPTLLHVSGTAPALVVFSQNGRRETRAFASGVEFHAYTTAGDATIDVISPHDGPLAGSLDFSTLPARAARDGLNDPLVLAPGEATIFAFEVTQETEIGVGLRAEPDRVAARLFDAAGKTLENGVALMRRLPPGRYFVEARAPADAAGPTTVRLALAGLSTPPVAPPVEVVANLLAQAGLKTQQRNASEKATP